MRAARAAACLWLLALPCLWPPAAAAEPPPPAPAAAGTEADGGDEAGLPPVLQAALEPWTGDLDGMVARGLIRVAIPVGLSTYYMDGAEQRGVTYELVRAFEQKLKKDLGRKGRRLVVAVLPAPPDRLLPMLAEGRADIAAGRLTVNAERQAAFAFSDPLRSDVAELVVTGPGSQPVESLDDLAGVPIHVRRSSSFWSSLEAINAERRARSAAPLTVVAADELLRSEDLLELVAAGSLPATVVDSPVAEMFDAIHPGAVVQYAVPLAEGRSYAWAFRKGEPKLAKAVNAFVAMARKGSRLGNAILQKYPGGGDWIANALADPERERFEAMAELFREHAVRYGFDWLLLVAQAYQESRLEQDRRSPRGAIGVMQLLPETARSPEVDIPHITRLEDNIHAGVRYLHHLGETYLSDSAMPEAERAFFSMAAYNAGPGNLAKARRRARQLGLDPDVWFDNVEIAMAQVVGSEPVAYVRNILKYYTAFRLLAETEAAREKVLAGAADPEPPVPEP